MDYFIYFGVFFLRTEMIVKDEHKSKVNDGHTWQYKKVPNNKRNILVTFLCIYF